ncbi:MAG: hypothetical protein U1F63_03190 [Chitinivorax sp.]
MTEKEKGRTAATPKTLSPDFTTSNQKTGSIDPLLLVHLLMLAVCLLMTWGGAA